MVTNILASGAIYPTLYNGPVARTFSKLVAQESEGILCAFPKLRSDERVSTDFDMVCCVCLTVGPSQKFRRL